jgi:hypothetical protein
VEVFTFLALLYAGALLLAFYGLGVVVVAFCYRGEKLPWAYSAALGMALFAFVAGGLNVAGVAVGAALNALVLAGLAHAVWVFHAGRRKPAGPRSANAALAEKVPLAILGVLTLYTGLMVLPAGIFNWHDDYYTYFPPVQRVLQTGALVDGAPGLAGASAAAAHALLSALPLALFAPQYVYLFDQVLCLFLAGALLEALGRRLGVAVRHRAAALAVLLLIHPQVVNVSAIYSSAAALLAIAHGALLALEPAGATRRPVADLARRVLPLGLLLALLSALKAPNVLIGPIVAASLLAAFVPGLGLKRLAPVAAAGALAALVFSSPWLPASWDRFGPQVRGWLAHAGLPAAHAQDSRGSAGASPPAPVSPQSPADTQRPWAWTGHLSATPLFHGATAIAYFAAVALAALAGAICLYQLLRDPGSPRRGALLAGAALGLAAVIGYFAVFRFVPASSPHWALRYAVPWLIGLAPACLLFAFGACLPASAGEPPPPGAQPLRTLLTLAAGMVAGAFLGPFVERLSLQAEQRSPYSMRVPRAHLAEVSSLLGPQWRARMREAQQQVPAGAGLATYAAGAFHLDFRRNPVTSIDLGGLPELLGPAAGAAAESAHLVRWLCGMRREHLVLQYRGAAARTDGDWSRFMLAVAALAGSAELIVNDAEFFVIRVACQASP